MKRHITRREMVRGFGLLVGASALAGCGGVRPLSEIDPPHLPELRVASYNIRYLDLTKRGQAVGRSLEDWQNRRGAVLAALQSIAPDIVAFQEMESWAGAPQNGAPVQRTWLSGQLPEYASASCTCGDGRESSQPIFYRRDRFTALAANTQSLSAALGVFSEAFAGYSDLVSWVQLHDRVTDSDVTVINLHLHFSNQLRQQDAAQLAVRIAKDAMERGDRVVVLGDMNVLSWARPIAVLRAGDLTRVPSQGASFHFNTGLHAFGAIDHILHGPRLVALSNVQILRSKIGDVWPSDHYPIWVDLRPI